MTVILNHGLWTIRLRGTIHQHFLSNHGRILYPNDIAETYGIAPERAAEICESLLEKGLVNVADFGENWNPSKQNAQKTKAISTSWSVSLPKEPEYPSSHKTRENG
jgi:hypothetical protein